MKFLFKILVFPASILRGNTLFNIFFIEEKIVAFLEIKNLFGDAVEKTNKS